MLISQSEWLNIVVLVVGCASPLQSVPQLYRILKDQNAGSVSVLTYILSAVFNVVWLLYGFAYNSWPNIVSGAGSSIVSSMIVVATQVYRPNYKLLPV